MKVLLLTVFIFAVAMLLLAIGALFFSRCIRGTCAGSLTCSPEGRDDTCGFCGGQKKLGAGRNPQQTDR
ncbi:MAG: hypothetical protein JW793_05165 [Acidobacteria bacterium]|nr:hypothetical protein [Acidobacteriota bacterium]